jgi:hypothetical protein
MPFYSIADMYGCYCTVWDQEKIPKAKTTRIYVRYNRVRLSIAALDGASDLLNGFSEFNGKIRTLISSREQNNRRNASPRTAPNPDTNNSFNCQSVGMVWNGMNQ